MDNDQLAARIRAFRKLKGYTQQAFADKIGVSLAILGAVERGARVPSKQLLKDITESLDIDLDELKGP
jgi:transcriptional regulator with XRE-family HTH domain